MDRLRKKKIMMTTRYADSVAKAFRFSVGVDLMEKSEMAMVMELLEGVGDSLLIEAGYLEEDGAQRQAELNAQHGMRLADIANALSRTLRVMDDEVA